MKKLLLLVALIVLSACGSTVVSSKNNATSTHSSVSSINGNTTSSTTQGNSTNTSSSHNGSTGTSSSVNVGSASSSTNTSTSDKNSTGNSSSGHTHNFDKWYYNTNEHYHLCECGESKDHEAHRGGTATETERAICEVCGRVYGNYSDFVAGEYPHLQSIGIDREEAHSAYQVLVYSFYDSDGDGYGDLRGLEEKLDYIEDLGSDIIWLSPIMPAESYHAYDVTSFYGIDPKLGTLDDYKSLVNTAHKKGIKILLDMPINHTSLNHEWFKGFAEGDSKYANYYQTPKAGVTNGNNSSMGETATFYTDLNSGKKYFAAFGRTMPDLNFQSQDVVNAIKDVFEYWVDLGADGFRFDAVKHIFDPNEIPMGSDSIAMNNAFFKDLDAHLKAINPNLYLLGENYSGQGEVKQYAQSFDAEFDFETWHTSLGAVTNQDPWGGSESHKYYDDTLIGCTNELIGLNPNWVPTFMTGNHDVTRSASYITSRVDDDRAALKLYAAMLMLRSGVPFVYYGDELGMLGENKNGSNALVGDAEVRLPMPFEDSTIDLEKMFYSTVDLGDGSDVNLLGTNVLNDWPGYKEDNPVVEQEMKRSSSLYNTYKSLIAFRKEHPALYKGTMAQVKDYNGCATIYEMKHEDETLYVAINFSSTSSVLTDVCDGTVEILFDVNGALADGNDITLSGRGVTIFKVDGEIYRDPIEEKPASKYALVVTPADGSDPYLVYLTYTEEFEGFTQYFGDNVQLNAGDKFKLRDTEANAEWVIKTISTYGQGAKFSVQADAIVCLEGGIYDFYIKFKWEQDEIYVGDQNGQ